MTKRAVLVIGPESAGNRVLTRLLVAAGCEGDGDHEQRWDERWPVDETPIVWLRSVPHGGKMPNFLNMYRGLLSRGYEPLIVVITRDWHSLVESQVRWGHVSDQEAAARSIRAAYEWIFAHIRAWPFVVVSYESMVIRPLETLQWLCAAVGIPCELETLPEEITDENAKYYLDPAYA